MKKDTNTAHLDQLDLFSIEPLEEVIQEPQEEPLSQFETIEVESTENNQEIEPADEIFRPFATVQVGDNVQVTKPIDKTPEAEGYFDYHKGRKGVVITVIENSKPLNENYQFYATVLFKNGEEGVFYDLELGVIN